MPTIIDLRPEIEKVSGRIAIVATQDGNSTTKKVNKLVLQAEGFNT